MPCGRHITEGCNGQSVVKCNNHEELDERPLDFVREGTNIYLGGKKKSENSVEIFFF